MPLDTSGPHAEQAVPAQRTRSSRNRRRRSPWIAVPLKLLFSLTLTGLFLEVALRIVGIQPAVSAVVKRSESDLHPLPWIAQAQRQGWIPWPQETRVIESVAEHPRGRIEMRRNDVSCREDQSTPLEKPIGRRRVVVLGDSHTDGFCFNDESFPNRWEQRTGDDVINAGFELSSPYQQWWAYSQVYKRFQPDHVVMTFYAGNDLLELLRTDDRVHLRREDERYVHAEPVSGNEISPPARGLVGRCRAWAREHLALYAGLRRVTFLRRLVRQASVDEYRDRLVAAQELHPGPVWQGLNQAYYFQHHPQDWDEAVARQRWVLTALRDDCQQAQVRFTLLILPTLRQIHPETDQASLDQTRTTLQLTDESLECDERACDAVAKLAQELRIELLDLRKPLREQREKEPKTSLFYQFDHHLNVAGHRLLAEQLDDTQ
ncbi:MAG: hypothetical protein ACKOBW_14070 [Planctomycetota bacterium]